MTITWGYPDLYIIWSDYDGVRVDRYDGDGYDRYLAALGKLKDKIGEYGTEIHFAGYGVDLRGK